MRAFFKRCVLCIAPLAPIFAFAPQSYGQAATVTTLTVPAGTLTPGTIINVTASVTVNGVAVTSGLVNFCDATATYCTDVHKIGSAQIAGNPAAARFAFRTGPGVHTYKAVFAGSTDLAPSTSANQQVTVTGSLASTATLAASGNAGSYALTGTVTSAGSPFAPTGNVQFQDTSNANFSFAAPTLGATTRTVSFTTLLSNDTFGTDSYFAATGDFNGDGRPDIAISNNSSNTVSVALQNLDGTFPGPVTVDVLAAPSRMVVADFNGDGIPDIAVACASGVSVLLSEGDGVFNVKSTNFGFTFGYAIAVGDFNIDGIPDLAVTDAGSGVVYILTGNGDGTFQNIENYPTGTYPEGVVVGDFNGDGRDDIAVSNFGNDNGTDSVTVLLGNANGTFTAAANLQVNPGGVVNGGTYDATDLVAADFNNDGKIDIAVTVPNRPAVVTFLGNGNGTFTNTSSVPLPFGFMTVADMNGDGVPDIASAGGVLLGNGDGTFTAPANQPAIGGYSPATADFNGDGIPDLLTANQTTDKASIAITGIAVSTTVTANNISPAGTGVDQIQAVYSGDAVYAASTSATVGLQDELLATTLSLSAAPPAGATFGQPITLTVSLNPFDAQGHATDGELVTFFNGTTVLGTSAIEEGSANFNVSPGVGINNLSASYPGAADFAPATSAVQSYRVFPSTPPVSTGTTTTLTASAATVAAGTVVTVTAAVTSGPTLVYPGQVNFCDATAAFCTDIHLLGTAQLNAAGTASISFVPGLGAHSYKAVFTGTSSDAASASAVQTVTVTGQSITQTAIAATGIPGHYTLTGTVTGTSDLLVSPSGAISFLDTTDDTTMGAAPLVLGPAGLDFPGLFTATTGANPQVVATGDFNHDGKVDVVFSNGNDNTLTVLLGNGDGTFTPVTNSPIATGGDPFSIAVGDFNGDGNQDLVVTDVNDDTLTILLGIGDGTFDQGPGREIPGRPVSVAIGDFDGDGVQDLAVVLSDEAKVYLLQGEGNGMFQPFEEAPAVGDNPNSVTVADFNGDGIPDLAVSNSLDSINAPGSVTILLGNGDGTFNQADVSPATGDYPIYITSGDLNGDGKADLAVANYSDGTVTVLLGNGDGSFTPSGGAISAGPEPSSIAIADFDGDGQPDLAVSAFGGDEISILLGNGGTYNEPAIQIGIQDEGTPSFVATADFNGDGVPDLVAAIGNLDQGTVITSRRRTTATAVLANVAPNGEVGTHNISASYNGDANYTGSASGTVPLVVAPASTTTLGITAAGNAVTTVASGTPVTLTATVSTGDGPINPGTITFCDATAALCENSAMLGTAQLSPAGVATLTLVPGIGSHSYDAMFAGTANGAPSTSAAQALNVTGLFPTQTTITATGTTGNYTFTANVAGSGNITPTGSVSFLDATSNNFSLGTAPLVAGATMLSLTPNPPLTTGPEPSAILVADFNNDGKPDMAVINNLLLCGGGPEPISIYLGNGDGNFTAGTGLPFGDCAYNLVAADFNNDGNIDIAVSGIQNGLIIYFGHGDGTFTPTPIAVDGAGAAFIATGDLNADGNADLLLLTFAGNTNVSAITVLLGAGNGTFTQVGTIQGGNENMDGLTIGDFNGDGVMDLAVVGQPIDQPPIVTVLPGNGNGTFGQAITTNLGNQFYLPTGNQFFVTADFNGDGKLDLAIEGVVLQNGTTISDGYYVLLGAGDGTFATGSGPVKTSPDPQEGSNSGSIAVADFNGDGIADIAVLNDDIVQILTGNGDGTFAASATIDSGAETDPDYLALVAADFNGDGVPDLAAVNSDALTVTVSLAARIHNTSATLANVNPHGTGTHNVDASYAGDTNFAASVSPATPVTATLPPVLIQASLTAANGTVPYGSLSITVMVSGTGSNAPAPTGSVFYYLDSLANPVAVPGTLVNGSITFTLPQIAVGNHFIDFSYSGDANYAGTPNNLPPASLAIPFQVVPASDTLAIAVTPNPVRTPNPVSIAATLTSTATGATGTVTFMDGAATLGQAPLGAGTAVLNGVVLSVGAHSIAATYSGDTNFNGSTAPAIATTVEGLAAQLTSIAPTLATAGAADTSITATGANFTAASVLNFNSTPIATTFVSPAQLQGVIPAALLVNAANATITVTDSATASASQPAAFTVVPQVAVTFSGPPTSDPGSQPVLDFQLQQAFPIDLNGTMTLTFTPDAGSPDDPQVQFATGGRTFNFTLAANTTTSPPIMLQSGTVAGTIGITLQLTSAGVNVTPASVQPIAIAVPTVAPTVTSVTYSASGTTLTVLVSGYSSTREMQQGTFTFTPASGISLSMNSITVPAATLFETWYSDNDSAQYGSSFTYTQTFTLSAPASQITGVSVTLTNSQGTSTDVNSQ